MTHTESSLDLGGSWERYIGSEYLDSIFVPSSYAPVGVATLRRRFELAALGDEKRAILRFEGVAFEGSVLVNGVGVGSAGWGRSDLDVTEALVGSENDISVEIRDWQVTLGPNAAWEGYGGIIRGVALHVCSDPYIENARLSYTLNHVRRVADCTLDVFIRGSRSASGTIAVQLSLHEQTIASESSEVDLEAGESVVSLTWRTEDIALWSPAAPNLYDLSVRLMVGRDEHVFSAETGFRALEIDGDKFLLNGERLVLKGIDRHDLWKDQGFTLTAQQIEQDFRMIKAMGANTVRLGCYPTDPRNLHWANRLGLLVSQEPGLCWIRFEDAPEETVERGLRNLEGLIRRDWNSPSFFAVMYANESYPSAENLRAATDLARTTMPGLFVSVTHLNYPLEESKRISDEGGLDFYGHHVYDYQAEGFDKAAAVFVGKPLVFTEWGGRGIGHAPIVMNVACGEIADLVERGRAAGHWFWSWQDIPEFTRQDAEMEDGILLSGVVTEERRIRTDVWGALSELFSHEPGERGEPSREPRSVVPIRQLGASRLSAFHTVSLQDLVDTSHQAAAWSALERSLEEYWRTNHFSESHWEESGARFWTWSVENPSVGPIPFSTPSIEGHTRPIVVGAPVTIDVDLEVDLLHFLGNATVPDGYPTTGVLGEQVGWYRVSHADGERHDLPLRWGYEVARSNMVAVASRLNPVTAVATRVLTYSKDVRREVHQTLLLSVPVERKRIASVEAEFLHRSEAIPASSRPNDTGSGYRAGAHYLLLYGLTGERRSGSDAD